MLDSIIEKYGLDAISKKTKISKKNLEKLLKKEFGSFSKPMALGFVSILEREYKQNFSDMKEDITKWFEDNSKSCENDIVFPPPEDEKNRRWIAILSLVAIMIFGFYLYQNEFSINKLDTKKNIVADETKESVDKIVYKKQNIQEQKDLQNNQKIKSNILPDENISTTKTSEAKKADSINSLNATNDIDSNKSINSYTPIESIFIYPSRKIWIGVVNLKNWQRTTITTPDTYTIEADSDKLIITGHGFFSIDDLSGNNTKYDDQKKHFFMLKDEELIELNESRFKKLNGGKIW